MIEIGKVCVKTAGRDAGNYCIIVEVLDKNYVMVDGNVRRRKCNIKHLEFLDKTVKIKEKAATKGVQAAMEKEGFEVKKKEKRTKPKKEKKEKPVKKRVIKMKERAEEKAAKKEKAKEETKKEKKK